MALLPLLVADTYMLKLLTYAGINVLVVVGLALLFGYAGQVSLGHAAFVGIGAYSFAYFAMQLKLPWIVAFLAAGVVSAAGGLVLALPSLKLKGHYLAMATLGFGELASLAFKEATPLTGGVNGLIGHSVARNRAMGDHHRRRELLVGVGGRRRGGADSREPDITAPGSRHARHSRQRAGGSGVAAWM